MKHQDPNNKADTENQHFWYPNANALHGVQDWTTLTGHASGPPRFPLSDMLSGPPWPFRSKSDASQLKYVPNIRLKPERPSVFFATDRFDTRRTRLHCPDIASKSPHINLILSYTRPLSNHGIHDRQSRPWHRQTCSSGEPNRRIKNFCSLQLAREAGRD